VEAEFILVVNGHSKDETAKELRNLEQKFIVEPPVAMHQRNADLLAL
jgi:glycosyltransferase involved in cell wall biosynthesis